MTVQQRLSPAKPIPARFTAEEFMALCQHPPISDWVGKVELVEGEIVRMPPPGLPHWNAQRLLHLKLLDLFRPLGPEWIVGIEGPVGLATGTVRVPDLVVLRAPDLTRLEGAIDRTELFIAIELADSSLRNDLGPKQRDYAEAGVSHYWVVDLRRRETHAMSVPESQAYAVTPVIAFDEPLPVPATDATITLS